MKRFRNASQAWVCTAIAAMCVLWNVSCASVHVSAADATAVTIVRVEEDWGLAVAAPDANSISPQVTCAISPTGDNYSTHATVELNHQSQPDFVAGGLQLETWSYETPMTSQKFPGNQVMTEPNEKVNWTQTMALADGMLKFEIINGTSETWEGFGGQGHRSAAVSTDLTNLNAYTPALSVKNSGVGYAANRVTSLVLKRVRLITSSGNVLEENTARIVHQHK